MYDEHIEAVLAVYREQALEVPTAHDVALQVVDTMCAQGLIDKDIDSVDLAMMQCEQRVEQIAPVLRHG